LEFHVICKLCEELRQAQRHAFLLSEKRAVTKLAMFLQLIDNSTLPKASKSPKSLCRWIARTSDGTPEITLEAVGRAFRTLTTRNIIKFRDRGHVRIIDRDALDKIAGDPPVLPAIELASRD